MRGYFPRRKKPAEAVHLRKKFVLVHTYRSLKNLSRVNFGTINTDLPRSDRFVQRIVTYENQSMRGNQRTAPRGCRIIGPTGDLLSSLIQMPLQVRVGVGTLRSFETSLAKGTSCSHPECTQPAAQSILPHPIFHLRISLRRGCPPRVVVCSAAGGVN